MSQREEAPKSFPFPSHGNQNSEMAPEHDPASLPGPNAFPAADKYGYNVAEKYIHVQDITIDRMNSNEKSERTAEEKGKFGDMGHGDYAEYTTPLQGESIKIDR